VIGRVCLFVGWFVRSFFLDARCDFSKSKVPIFKLEKLAHIFSMCTKFYYYGSVV